MTASSPQGCSLREFLLMEFIVTLTRFNSSSLWDFQLGCKFLVSLIKGAGCIIVIYLSCARDGRELIHSGVWWIVIVRYPSIRWYTTLLWPLPSDDAAPVWGTH